MLHMALLVTFPIKGAKRALQLMLRALHAKEKLLVAMM